MNKKIKVSIIIVSYNNPNVLKDTLVSLYDNISELEFEVIVVDNNSHEKNVEMIKTEFPQVKLIENNENSGFAKGCNIGAKVADGEFLLFVNSDIILEGNPVVDMLECYQDSTIGIVGAQLTNADGSIQPSSFRFPKLGMRFLQLSGLKNIIVKVFPKARYSGNKREVDYISGAFLMITKKLFFDVGMFDENYFMYQEDADLGYQVKLAGKKSILLTTRKVIHLNENHENEINPFVFTLLNIGQLLFYKKNYSILKFKFLAFMSIFFFFLKFCLTLDNKKRKSVYNILKMYIVALFTNRIDKFKAN